MLPHDQFKTLIDKEKLKLEDLLLMEHHIMAISQIMNENAEILDDDVLTNLSRDLDLIIKRLEKERKSFAKSKLKLITGKQE